MRRHVIVVGTLAGALVVTVAGGALLQWQTGPRSPPVTVPAGVAYTLDACHPYSVPVGAGDFNQVVTMLRDPLAVGGDVAASTRLGDGRRVWMLGDTEGGVAVRNTMLISDTRCLSVVIAPTRGAAIPDRADDVGYWPMALATTHAHGVTRLTVSAQRVRGTEAGLAFENLGPAVATFAIPDGGAPVYLGVGDLGADNPSRTTVGWGAALVDGADGWWYMYGTSNPERPLVFGWSVRVARTPAGEAEDRTTWQYWSGTRWTRRASAAVEVIAAVGGVSQTFSVVHRQGRWYAISKRDGVFGTDLAVWPAAGPAGPFGEPVTVGRIPSTTSPSALVYMPLAHPELPTASPDDIVVSVSRNSTDVALLTRQPSKYRPFFLDVGLPPRSSQADLRPR